MGLGQAEPLGGAELGAGKVEGTAEFHVGGHLADERGSIQKDLGREGEGAGAGAGEV